MLEFKLPDVAEGIHEAEILRWMVAPGEQVKLDQPMVEIQTDKSVAEIGAPVSGKVLEILAQPGTIARVGEVLVAGAAGHADCPQSSERLGQRGGACTGRLGGAASRCVLGRGVFWRGGIWQTPG